MVNRNRVVDLNGLILLVRLKVGLGLISDGRLHYSGVIRFGPHHVG